MWFAEPAEKVVYLQNLVVDDRVLLQGFEHYGEFYILRC